MIMDREDFKRYILTALGAPIIKINVTDEQLEDRIDECVDLWHQYHYDGSVRTILKQRITASELHIRETLKEPLSSVMIKGLDSKAAAKVVEYSCGAESSSHTIFCEGIRGDFIKGEKIRVGEHEFHLVDDPSFLKKGIIDEKKIKMPPWVIGVTKIFPVNQATSSQNLFDVQYQMRLSDIYDLTSTSLIYYEQAMEHLQLLNFELTANPWFEYNRHDGYVYPVMRWGVDASVGDYLLLEVYRALDPRQVPQIWNDTWLKRYAIATVKAQWGSNLRKYNNIQLAGGATLNADAIYSEGVQERKDLEDQMMNCMPPSAFMVG